MLFRWMPVVALAALVAMQGCTAGKPKAAVAIPSGPTFPGIVGIARPVPTAIPKQTGETFVLNQGKSFFERHPATLPGQANRRTVYPVLFKFTGKNPKISARVESDDFQPIPLETSGMPPGQAVALLPAAFPPNLPYVELKLTTSTGTRREIVKLPQGLIQPRYGPNETGMTTTFGKGMLAVGRAVRMPGGGVRLQVWLPKAVEPGNRVYFEDCRIFPPYGELPADLRGTQQPRIAWDVTNPFAPYYSMVGIEGYAQEFETETEILPVTLAEGEREAVRTSVSGKRVKISALGSARYSASVIDAEGEFWVERLGSRQSKPSGKIDLSDLKGPTKTFRLTVLTMKPKRVFPWYLILPVEPESAGRQRAALE